MKAVERKLNKAQLATIWLLVISLLLAAAYVTVIVIVNKIANDNQNSSGGLTADDIIEGVEGTYLGQAIAYPALTEDQITNIEVSGPDNRFGISRYPNDLGSFRLHYYPNGDESSLIYFNPPILNADNANYEGLYAIEQNDGYGRIYCLTYLCAALTSPYITERIELPSADTEEGAKKRADLLRAYGFTQSEATTISFMYGERNADTGHIEEGSEQIRILTIGKKALSGNGFYFRVDNRDYVYYTRTEYFEYALSGIDKFIKGMLVAEGIGNEAVYAPHLTTDFKEWKTTVFKSGNVFLKTDAGYEKFENPSVVVNGSYNVSIDEGLGVKSEEQIKDFMGYDTVANTSFSFDLEAYKDHPEYDKIVAAFKGKKIGAQEEKIILTLLTELENQQAKQLTFDASGKSVYTYSVSKVESAIGENGERMSGTVSASDTAIKVTYRYTVGGITVYHDCHAVISISDLPASAVAEIVGIEIGKTLGAPITFDITYDKDNSNSIKEKYVVKNIDAIFDKDGQATSVVTADSAVILDYYVVVNGVVGELKKSDPIKLSGISDTHKLAPLKTELLGKGKGAVNSDGSGFTVYEDLMYYEYAREFVTYEIDEIKYLVANEIIVSFEFCNASERDPYYGNTYFKNTLENENKLYGLNPGTCETAVKLLGGIDDEGSSAAGLFGTTVAVGLDIETMEKYDLYAHKIYFELPRGIYDPTANQEEADQSNLNDFRWVREIGFTLYVSGSKFDEDGTRIRYIGSDMYNIVAKVNAEDFDFLEYEFVEFWARRDLIAMDITKVEALSLEFKMEDLSGKFDFEVFFEEKYGGTLNGEFVFRDEAFDGSSKLTHERIMVKASDYNFDTPFTDKFGTKWGNLASLYNDTMGDGKTTLYPGSKQTLGASYFNSVFETIMFTTYIDCLTEEEQDKGFEDGNVIMTMTLKVEGKEYDYTYDFYRLDDRRIMVSLYRTDPTTGEEVESLGKVSDFYITTYAFKKLVNNYISLLSGQETGEQVGYPENK